VIISRLLAAPIVGIVLAGGAVAATAAAAPSDAPPAALQADLDRVVADGIPGVIALQRQGDQVRHATAGVRDMRTGDPIRATDRFRIGSNTKSFISTVILQFEAEHRLRLTDTVQRWLPGVVPDGGAITIRELLNHTSGIPEYGDVPFVLQNRYRPLQPIDLVRHALAQPPLFPPGTGWSYSNTNYILLGMIIGRVDHLPEQYAPVWEINRRIIVPLGLAHTSFPVTDPGIAGPHPRGYIIDPPPEYHLPGTTDATVWSPSWAWTAGAIISTADDLARFHRALVTGRLLPPAQQHELLDAVPEGEGDVEYGLGIMHAHTPCGDAWGHEGDFPGYQSVSLTSPDGTRQAVLFGNRESDSNTDQVQRDLATALFTAFCG
jgi:D-alanyl-D-alanine carboxypeptidase